MKGPEIAPDEILRGLMTGAILWKCGRVSIETLAISPLALAKAAAGIMLAAEGTLEMAGWKGGHDPALLEEVRTALSRLRLLFSFLAAQPKAVRTVLHRPIRLLGQAIGDLDEAFAIDPFMN